MGDEIPNEDYSLVCASCKHHNLPWRVFCFMCANRLRTPEVPND